MALASYVRATIGDIACSCHSSTIAVRAWRIVVLMPRTSTDTELLQAALLGYEIQRDRITEQIAAIRKVIEEQTRAGKGSAIPVKKRTLSAAGRRRIAVAQRKRWAAVKGAGRRSALPGNDPTPPK